MCQPSISQLQSYITLCAIENQSPKYLEQCRTPDGEQFIWNAHKMQFAGQSDHILCRFPLQMLCRRLRLARL